MSQIKTAPKHTRSLLNVATTKLAIVATPVVLASSAFAEDTNSIDVGSLGITGLAAAAATVFAIKAGPSLMMWGYRKMLGFIGR